MTRIGQIRLIRRIGKPRGIYIALALLTLCAVFAAAAGVREALATSTQELRTTLAAAPSTAKSITATTTFESVATDLSTANPNEATSPLLTEAQAGEVTRQLRGDFDRGQVSLAPASADWASMTTQALPVQSPIPATKGIGVNLEVTYRQPLRQYVRLVAGALPAAPRPAPPPETTAPAGGVFTIGPGGGILPYYPVIQVVVTQQTAATFGLRVGSTVKLQGPETAFNAQNEDVKMEVSGIVAPVDPDASFWTLDSAPAAPTLENADSFNPPPYWVGGLIAGPGEATAIQADFGRNGLSMEWVFPLSLGSLQAQQAQPLDNALTALGTETPQLSGDVASLAPGITVSSDLQTTFATFFATEQSVDTVSWLLYMSLTLTVLAVLLLAARMVALRRSAELAVMRSRGASLWQVAFTTGSTAALICVPAAAAGAGLALLAVPDAGSLQEAGAGGWWPPLAVLVFAVCGPAIIAAWQHRLPRSQARRAVRGRQPRSRVRLVTEVTLVAAAVAGIIVFRKQGNPAGAGVNFYTSAAPVLIAIPVVIVVLRLYPLVLRGLLRASARGDGAPAFLGLARATRTALTPALPAYALVLALTAAAFAGMVRDAVTNGDVASSWQAAGADVRITGVPAFPNFSMSTAQANAVADVPGVTHEADIWTSTWVSAGGARITVVAVDPASYAALVADTQGFPQVSAGLLAVPGKPGTAQPVLASPAAAASLGSGTVTMSSTFPVRPVSVRIAGTVSSTPAWPAGGSFIIMPLAALVSTAVPPASPPVQFNQVLLTGSNIDRARLAAVLKDVLPAGGMTTYRADILAALTSAPLQHGAFFLFALCLAAAAGLGLAVMLLELALGAAEREATLARLATMGLGERQRATMVALEVLPAVIAAGLSGWVCALVLPRLVAPDIDLSVFTTSQIPVQIAPGVPLGVTVPLVPDVASIALPLAALIVFAAVALWIEIRAGRRRGPAAALRIGG